MFFVVVVAFLQVGVVLKAQNHSHPKKGAMAVYPALFCSCVMTVLTLAHGRGLPTDSMKNSVKLQVENIISRIQKHKDEVNTKRANYSFHSFLAPGYLQVYLYHSGVKFLTLIGQVVVLKKDCIVGA